MIRHTEPIGALAQTFEDPRRRCLRREQHAVRSNLGPIENLSERGMCIMADRTPDQARAHAIELIAMDHTVSVTGRVIWTRRIGQFRVAVGIRFEDVDRETARRIDLMARRHERSRHRSVRRAG